MGMLCLVKTISGRCLVTIVLVLSCACLISSQTCYTPYGSILPNYGICHPSLNKSLCCGVGDKCFSNQLCQAADKTFYRGGCMDKTYSASEGCPSFCNSSFPQYFPPGVNPSPGGAAYLIAQCGSIGSIFYCCDGDKSRQCCNDPKNDLRLPVADIAFFASAPTQDGASTPAIASIASSSTTKPAAQVSTSMTSLRTPTAQATSSVSSSTSADNTTYVVTPSISVSTSTDNTMIVVSQTERSPSSGAPQSLPTTFATDPELVSPSQSNNHTVIIGASAGSSVAAVVILLGVFTCIWLQRHPPEQEDQEAGVERAAVLRPSRRPAPASDWAESTLIDSHSHHLPLSRTNSHAQDAVELKSPTLRSQASSTHAPASPLRTPDQQSHSHFPPAELESSFDVAPIHVPFHAPSRPPPPPPVELEARDGVTVTALWRAGSPPNSSRKPPTLGSPLSTILQSPHSSIEQRSVVSPVVETPRESLSPEQERRQDPHESGGSHKPEQAIVPGRSPQSTASESRSRAGGSDGLA